MKVNYTENNQFGSTKMRMLWASQLNKNEVTSLRGIMK